MIVFTVSNHLLEYYISWFESMSGIVGLDPKCNSEIVHIKPGHYEEYELDTFGKVTFKEQVQFYKVGECPLHRNMMDPYGRYKYSLFLLISIP